MMKKFFMLMVALTTVVTVSAQFEQGKTYISASLSGLDLNYNGSTKFSCGFEAKGGYFVEDNLMVLANLDTTAWVATTLRPTGSQQEPWEDITSSKMASTSERASTTSMPTTVTTTLCQRWRWDMRFSSTEQ